jgi:hypothetical protein
MEIEMPDAIYLQQNGTLDSTINIIEYKQGEAQTSGSPPSQNPTQLTYHRNVIGLYPEQH